MIKYKIFFLFTLSEIVVLGIFFVYGISESMTRSNRHYPAMQELVGCLQLTDLALWTEARYTRHPSQADLFSPFQDFPSSLDHFPAGSIVGPPRPGQQ